MGLTSIGVINGQFHRTSSRRPSWSPTTLQIGSKFIKFEAATPSLKPVQTNSVSFNYKLEPVGEHHPDCQLPD